MTRRSEIAESELPIGEVTALREHARRPGRVVLEVAGFAVGALTIDLVSELGLRVGSVLGETEGAALAAAVRRTGLLDRALDLLAVRGRSVRDLELRLRRLQALASDIAWVVERLLAQGILNDAQYAREVARSRLATGGVSRRRVQTELYRRGVAADVAARAIAEIVAETDIDESGAARAAAVKRLRALRNVDRATARRRVYAFLARRGYESALITQVLREVLDGADDATDAP
jgi:regulatory protein